MKPNQEVHNKNRKNSRSAKKHYHSISNLERTGIVQAITTHRELDRGKLFAQLGLEASNFVCCHQTHSNEIILVDENFIADRTLPISHGDAIITRCPEIAIGVFTADCVPIFLLDLETPAIGIIHAGWRGTIKNISTLTTKKMIKSFGTNPKSCVAHIGVSIQKCCYNVSRELADRFEKKFGAEVRNEQHQLDLQKANRLQLVEAGIPEKAITISPFCTSCRTDLFYSYRAEKKRTGRLISLMRLRPQKVV